MIVDEIMTFFFAGSQTSASSTQNLCLNLLLHPKYTQDILNELEEEVIQPYLAEQVKAGKMKVGEKVDLGKDFNILDLFDFENVGTLKNYTNCFNEAMRMQPPVYYSSSVKMMETVTAGGYTIRKGDPFLISMNHLCNNPDEWIEPEKFIPERFNAGHSHYLTPSGAKRNPYSFSPFLGG